MLLAPGFAIAQPAAAPSAAAPSAEAANTIQGSVKDTSGSVVVGAIVTLENGAPPNPRTTVTDQAGSFHFSAVQPGDYKVTITAPGFSEWSAASTAEVTVAAGVNPPALSAVLQVAPSSTQVEVGLTAHELAVEQVKAEEKQRILGLFPNFFVSYDPDPAPLTAAQKAQLGWKTITDPVVLAGAALSAGIQQARNEYPEFGYGTEGFAKRLGAQYAERVSGVMIGVVLTNAVFHQDPRYFYKGTGSVGRRLLYAFGTAFLRKGDNGHWQPDYSDVVGTLAAGELATLYYPASSRTGLRLAHDVMLEFGARAFQNVLQEFVLRKLTTNVPASAAVSSQPMLREGTPVSLISAEDLSSKTSGDTGPIGFVLTADLRVNGAIVAPAGSKASGQVSYSSVPGSQTQATRLALEKMHLKVGNAEVPLRSTQARSAGGAVEVHRLENSGRIEIVLYVAENIPIQTQP